VYSVLGAEWLEQAQDQLSCAPAVAGCAKEPRVEIQTIERIVGVKVRCGVIVRAE